MIKQELFQKMAFTRAGQKREPLFVAEVDDKYILAAYQGSLSKYDILIKYRQSEHGKWSRIRTPKHIHWAVDILIKMHGDKDGTKAFLEFLINKWASIRGIKSDKERNAILNLEFLLEENREAIITYRSLGHKGEYSVKFLILLAQLLMIQEKTNLESAYMFKNLMDALKRGNDIFQIVSIATHH